MSVQATLRRVVPPDLLRDKCDKCGVQAVTAVQINVASSSGRLTFCGHHLDSEWQGLEKIVTGMIDLRPHLIDTDWSTKS